jgi:hypothetical protein
MRAHLRRYTSPDMTTWTLNVTDVIPSHPYGAGANLYTPVLAHNIEMGYYVLMFQCSGGCSDGQLQVATAAQPWGPFLPNGTVLPSSDPRFGSSQGGIWVDRSVTPPKAYFIFNRCPPPPPLVLLTISATDKAK